MTFTPLNIILFGVVALLGVGLCEAPSRDATEGSVEGSPQLIPSLQLFSIQILYSRL